MDYIEATQVIKDRQTIGRINDGQSKSIGVLRVGSKEFRITEGLNRIGRSPVCAVVLEDPTVSKVHAEIHAGSDASYITDLRSANGTILKKLSLKTFFFYPINDGDVITFGQVKAIYATTFDPVGTPETPVEQKRASFKSGFSFEEVNESVVPGSQRNSNKRRLFRCPEIPEIDVQRNRGRISEVAEASGKSNTTGIEDSDIHNAETQGIVDFEKSVVKSGKFERSKRLSETNESPKEAKPMEDIDDMETQIPLLSSPPIIRQGENSRLRKLPIDEDIFEAETQVLGPVGKPASKLPISVAADRDDTDDEVANNNRDRSAECQVIAETDDETNDQSDGSVTDVENEFANFRTEIKEPKTTTVGSKVESTAGIHDAETQRMGDSLGAPPARSARVIDDNEADLDLMPTQVINVATSTPMSRPTKSPMNFDFDESIPVVDYQDIHTALTQVVSATDRAATDPNDRPESSPAPKETERNESPDTTINSTGDGLEKKLGNMFGNEVTSDTETTEEPTQLMTQNLVDILKMTQHSASPTLPEKSPIAGGSKVARKSHSPEGRKFGAPDVLGFIDGRAIDNHPDSPRTPTSRNFKDDSARSASGPSRLLASNDNNDDDVLAGLPKFKIYGTLSNPGSPTSSENSSDDENLASSTRRSLGNVDNVAKRTKRNGKTDRATDFRARKSHEPDSPTVTKKLRARGKAVARNRITDDERDSEEDLNYNDLKSIADKLLSAPESAEDTTKQVRRTGTETRIALNVTKASDVVTKKMVANRRPSRKLSKALSSLTVADSNFSDRIGDDSETEKSGIAESSICRRSVSHCGIDASTTRKRTRVDAKMKYGIATKKMKRSVDDPAPKLDNTVPTLTIKCKDYAKVQLMRLNETEITRTKRTATKITKDGTSESSPRARVTNRRTIGGPIVKSPSTSIKEQHKVLFTGVKDEDYERMVVKLGGVVVSDPSKASVLITDKVRRTFKFLCAVAQGMKIVDVNWLIESNDAGRFLDCDSFTLQDPAAENKFKFKLGKSLNIARTKKLLAGYTIIVTPKVNQPEIHELKGMAEACGGRVLVRVGRTWDEKTVILSREDDLAAAKAIQSKAPKSLKISVQSTEFLLTGILRQEINLVDHKLL